MSIYLDLLPPPQFDRSLIAYVVGNFSRVKDALVRASGRTYVFMASTNGPWPKNFIVTHPFRADVLAVYAATCYSAAVGMSGTVLQMDGVIQGNWGYYFFNEASSHKQTTGAAVVRSVPVGDHTWTIAGNPGGNMLSDANDWGYIAFTMTEV